MYDWNGDGKIDAEDLLLEDDYWDECHGSSGGSSYSGGSGSGISTFGAIASVVLGLVLTAVVMVAFGADVENVPGIVLVILWSVFAAGSAVVFEKIGL